jgi:hypothetical protein
MEAYVKQLTAGIQELLCHDTDGMKVETRFNGDLITYDKIMQFYKLIYTIKVINKRFLVYRKYIYQKMEKPH